MSHEPERERGRELELQKAIHDLRREIDEDLEGAPAEARRVYSVMARVLAILNSEYGTQMRILDRQDKMNEALYGDGNGNPGIVSEVKEWRKVRKFVMKAVSAVVVALCVLAATKYYENIKLNEIIAAQKVQAAKP